MRTCHRGEGAAEPRDGPLTVGSAQAGAGRGTGMCLRSEPKARGDALEKEMATHSSILAWRIPGTMEPGGLPSIGSHRVGYD